MKIAGLDLSITSSGVSILTLDDKLNVTNTESFGFTERRKYSTDNIVFYNNDDFRDHYDKFVFMFKYIFDWVKDCDYIAVEDYAMGSTGATGMIFDLGEFEGFIKLSLFNQGKKLRFYAINSIKKFWTGYGLSDKISMYNAFVNFKGLKPDISQFKPVTNGHGAKTISDIVDSFAIVMMLLTELQYRNKLKKIETDVDKAIFLGAKKNPGVLSHNFIEKLK